jgi:hypothetical protein
MSPTPASRKSLRATRSLHLGLSPRTRAHSMQRKQEIDRETGEMLSRLLHDLTTRRDAAVAEAERLRCEISDLLTCY